MKWPPVQARKDSEPAGNVTPPRLPDADSGSAAIIATTGSFAVNVLAEGQEPLSDRFSSRGVDRFAGLEVARGRPGLATGLNRAAGALFVLLGLRLAVSR